MSPVPPPPAGTLVPSDDWTDDPSFDFNTNASNFMLPFSPSPSSSSSHRSSLSQSLTSSPLRQVHTSGKAGGLKKPEEEVDSLDDDFDLPAGDLPPLPSPRNKPHRPRSSAASSSSSSSHITRTVVGAGPKGVGTITKLGGEGGSPSVPSSGILAGTVNARARALEQSWEADVGLDDFEKAFGEEEDRSATLKLKGGLHDLGGKRLSSSRKEFAGADALDDFMDLDDEDQATLKAGATIKALLPPPRNRKPAATPSHESATLEDELEADFALPLNLTNLTLATQPASRPRRTGPRDSIASTVNSESWGSPSTSASGKKYGWGSEDSPSGKRFSETSATSVSDGFAENYGMEKDELNAEEDLEDGLEFEPTFFSASRTKELNSILDRKRRPEYAPAPSPPGDIKRAADDSFEDGLVLDDPGIELSRHRLRAQKRARDRNPPLTLRKGQPQKSVVKEREKAWEKQREQGWGRNTPVPPPHGSIRERTQSGLGGLGALGLALRSHSISTVVRDSSRPSDVGVSGREKEAMRSRSGHLLNMGPPPVPASSTPSQPPTPSASRLRHQKSHFHLAAPPQSPSLTRKQSLASLQDAIAQSGSVSSMGSHFEQFGLPPMPSLNHASLGAKDRDRYHSSTSRLTMPTSSSRAKIRPPVSSIFPKADLLTSTTLTTSSIPHPFPPHSTMSLRNRMHSTPTSSPSTSSSPTYAMTMNMSSSRRKLYGDGSELDGIDDLRVDEDLSSWTIGKGQGGGSVRNMAGLGLGKPSKREHEHLLHSHGHTQGYLQTQATGQKDKPQEEKRKKSGGTQLATRKIRRKGAGLIKHLGGADKKKVVGEMTWNPTTLRWEGNESILRDFDTISSTRPALITHYTGSSVGAGVSSPIASTSAAVAPRIVGDMQFDPIHMKWVSILPSDEDEPDPFEGMADDEDEEAGGGTIRAGAGRRFVPIGPGSGSVASSSTWSQRLTSESSMSIAASSASWEDRTRPSVGVEISPELWAECKEAEERHRKEMRGWIMRPPNGSSEIRERQRREEKRLWEIRNLAMRS
ncbi:GTPase activator, putative [Cryptococcus deneoformans JEC21]|uniref:GTPase activator, putative n=1 Tax=Cryptococcus deneoformans (strain JEC21 / ATCC MYA-565) TaxID=214684 RepID=Q5K7A5_CRYD1|nr:GTPase activator, putative [Cryptococcus neoformans var. neoformans JEC21]AAW47069.1 GTPase activator, putative [Cryptococcus neoformans var. neoformans JEC21]